MSKAFCIPGVVFLFCALVLSFLASISLPYLTALDIVRVKFPNEAALSTSTTPIDELRFGIWTACWYAEETRTCLNNGYAYEVSVDSDNVEEPVTIGASWTRGLVVTPIATAVTLIALLLALSSNLFVVLLASLASFLAALMHLIVFAIQIALFARVRNEMNDLEIEASTRPSAGFWLVFASLILTLLAGCTVCFGRRRDKAAARGARAIGTTVPPAEAAQPATSEKTGFFSRFRK